MLLLDSQAKLAKLGNFNMVIFTVPTTQAYQCNNISILMTGL